MLRPTWAEIDLGAIAHNVRVIKDYVGSNTKVMAVVKADGYGHGAAAVARTSLKAGAEYLAVATADEAVDLREAGITAPILVLGTSFPGCGEDKLVELDITQAVCTLELAEAIERAAAERGKKALVHIKVETGMGRIGVAAEEGADFIARIGKLPHLEIEGLFTHFAAADEEDKGYTWEQYKRFMGLVEDLEARNIKVPPLKHVCNSAAILDLPEMHLDMVRPGAILYGFHPGPQVKKVLPLRPALFLKTRIVFLKEVKAGARLSYGLTYTVAGGTKIATLPIGYADGYRRHFSNRSEVLVRGRRVPVVGRVCMDQCLIDVGQVPDVAVGDEATLIGRQGDEEITAIELADLIGTLAIDLTCGIGKRVPRIYKE
ncbi:MAG: alanine racemase [bacterium]|jgi:alanine racemase